jgi:gas vesicle protein
MRARLKASSREDLAAVQTHLALLCSTSCPERVKLARPIVDYAYKEVVEADARHFARDVQLEAARLSVWGTLLGAVVGAAASTVFAAFLTLVVQRKSSADLKATVDSLNETIRLSAKNIRSTLAHPASTVRNAVRTKNRRSKVTTDDGAQN